MYKVKNNTTPKVITKLFHRIQNKYNTKLSTDNFSLPKTVSKTTNFAISNRGPTLWNKLLSTTEKQIDSPSLFKATIKKLLLNSTNELVYLKKIKQTNSNSKFKHILLSSKGTGRPDFSYSLLRVPVIVININPGADLGVVKLVARLS